MRNRSNIFNDSYFHTGRGDTTDSRLTSGAGSLDPNFNFFHTEQLGFLGGIAGDNLSSISGTLAGTFKTVLTAGGPADHVAVQIGKSNLREQF